MAGPWLLATEVLLANGRKASENVKARDKEREIDACKKQSQKHPIQDISVRVQTEKWNHLEIQI